MVLLMFVMVLAAVGPKKILMIMKTVQLARMVPLV
jgi:hypothetical protein